MARDRAAVWRALAGGAGAAVAAWASPAAADLVQFGGNMAASAEGLGNFLAQVEYSHDGAGMGTLIVSLTNTTDPLVGGFLTGFVFNVDSGDPFATAVLIDTNYPALLGVLNEDAPPFGSSYSAGAATHGNWSAGGRSSKNAIATGETGVFTFKVTASDADLLTASGFGLTGPYQFNFVVRFHAMEAGAGSDKVPNPAPGTLGLLAAAGAVSMRRRR